MSSVTTVITNCGVIYSINKRPFGTYDPNTKTLITYHTAPKYAGERGIQIRTSGIQMPTNGRFYSLYKDAAAKAKEQYSSATVEYLKARYPHLRIVKPAFLV